MLDADFLADTNRWVGVFIAVVGSIVVAPAGAKLLWRTSWGWLKRQGVRTRNQLARVLPFLRRNVIVRPVGVAGEASMSGALVATASGRVWWPTAPVDERIEALRGYLLELEGRLNETNRQVRSERSDRESAIARLEQALKTETTELRRALDEMDRETAMIDARGLPVIGFGIVLSGIPDELSAIPWHLGWALPPLGVFSALMATFHAIRVHRARARTP